MDILLDSLLKPRHYTLYSVDCINTKQPKTGNGSIGSLIIVRDFQKSLNISLVLYSQCNQVKHPIKFKGNDIRNVGLKKQPRYVSQASYHCRRLLYLFPFVKYEDYIDGGCK